MGVTRRSLLGFLVVIAIIHAGIPLASAENARLEFGVLKSGSIRTVGEVDTFSFSASSGDTIFIKMTKTSGDLWPRVNLYAPDGRSIKEYHSSSHVVIAQALSSGGTYNILADDGTSWEQTGDYNIVAQRLNNPDNAIAITPGVNSGGSIGIIGKVDTYTFSANSGDTAVVKASKTNGDIWPQIRLYSPDGREIKSVHSSSTTEMSQTLTSDGRHVILIDDGTSWAHTGDYNLILQLLPAGGAAETASSVGNAATQETISSSHATTTQTAPTGESGFPTFYILAAVVGIALVGGAVVAVRRRGGGVTPPRSVLGGVTKGAVARKVVGSDIFISYSTEDKPIADAMCSSLESRGIRCWIAPRDILPGTNFQEAIIDAIDSSKIMILVFSSHSNNSPHVLRELTRAISKGVVVVPFRIEDVSPSKSMEYLISVPHWLNAMTPPLEQHLERLAQTVQVLLEQLEDKEAFQ